MDFSQRPP